MKSVIRMILCLMSVMLATISCSSSQNKPLEKKTSKIYVLSTTAMVEDLVSHIGKEHIQSMLLIKGELDPHSYELVKGDYEKIEKASVIFFNGLNLEHGASLKYLLETSAKSFSVGEEIFKKKESELICVDGHIDPHIWMDVALFSHAIDPIVEKLSELDPEHAKEFEQNGKELSEKMGQLDYYILNLMHQIPKQSRYLIASHDAFFYFTKRYLAEESEKQERTLWQTRFAALEGLAPDGQISTQDIQKLMDHAITYNVKVVFPESNLNPDGVKKVVHVLNKKGVKARLAYDFLYGDAVGDKNSGAETYLEMMKHNASVIHKNLMENER